MDGAGSAQSISQEIVDVEQSPVKRQSIGNCWIYATTSWAESLALSGSGTLYNFSETYWTYWHWFGVIVGSAPDRLATGGTFSTMAHLIRTFGAAQEGSFIPEEATVEMSGRQKRALDAINASLASGTLSTVEARGDRERVRAELDRVFELSPSVRSELDRVFGADVRRTVRKLKKGSSSLVLRPDAIAVAYRQANGQRKSSTLLEALDDWHQTSYPSRPSSRRVLQQRIQRALHARVPVILSWFVDFNALGPNGAFAALSERPGSQGSHLSVAEDYEVRDVPGYGTLRAGTLETRPAALEAALDPSATVVLLRTKNSWGTWRPDRRFVPGYPGYHDLHFRYLDGPVRQCREKNGATDPTDCPWTVTPLSGVLMPDGY
jgi:hypothetical protein